VSKTFGGGGSSQGGTYRGKKKKKFGKQNLTSKKKRGVITEDVIGRTWRGWLADQGDWPGRQKKTLPGEVTESWGGGPKKARQGQVKMELGRRFQM